MSEVGVIDDEDEMLLDPLTAAEESSLGMTEPEKQRDTIKVQKSEISKMAKRVVHLESLLSSNLDNLTSQQKYYDCEV
jgi:hypothetical protein